MINVLRIQRPFELGARQKYARVEFHSYAGHAYLGRDLVEFKPYIPFLPMWGWNIRVDTSRAAQIRVLHQFKNYIEQHYGPCHLGNEFLDYGFGSPAPAE